MFIPEKLSDALDRQLASLESEVGTFLQQKARILALPPSFPRTRLLEENAALKSRSASTIASAQTLKTRLTDFDPFDFKNWSQIKPLTLNAADIAQALSSLHTDMLSHKLSVDSASGSLPTSPASTFTQPSTPPHAPSSFQAAYAQALPLAQFSKAKAVGLVVAGAVVWWMNRRK